MLIIFDLDGVLVDSRGLHFDALNQAISEIAGSEHCITREAHLRGLDGIPTHEKLRRMEFLTDEQRSDIAQRKQELTRQALTTMQINPNLQTVIQRLQADGHSIAVASNSVRATVEAALSALSTEVQLVLSNEDVDRPKPNPEMYLRAMIACGVGPKETVIVEDSPTGREAADRSGAQVVPVVSPDDVTYERIVQVLGTRPRPWHSDMNVLIPMAGAGSRFVGYTFPKPLIEINGKPMIQTVVENLAIEAHCIFICQKSHVAQYNLRQLLRLLAPGCDIVEVDGITEGAACTALLAESLINNDTPLLIANADQYMEWDATSFYWWTANTDADGALLTFQSTHPKWSFVRLGEYGDVVEVAEKNPISDVATCGIYWWRHGADFVRSVRKMQAMNDRTNGEFYIAPAFNYAIEDGAYIASWPVDAMWGLGTPEDLRAFLDRD